MTAFISQQPVVFAALVTGAVAILTLIVNASLTRSLHQQRLQADLALSRERGVQEMKLAERKADLERHAADWQRKAEFAEEVLAEFGEMVALFRGMGQQTPKMEPASKSL